MLTVVKSDVEWAAHRGRNVVGAIEKSVASERSLTVCAGELCGRLAMEGYDLSIEMQASNQERMWERLLAVITVTNGWDIRFGKIDGFSLQGRSCRKLK